MRLGRKIDVATVVGHVIAFGLATIIVGAAADASAGAATIPPPLKEVLRAHFGAGVDGANPGSFFCLDQSASCQPATGSNRAGGFAFPAGVTIASNGNVLVADNNNNRVQEITPSGTFVSMFGWGVNQTKDKDSEATQAERNVCTAASHDTCGPGEEGGLAGQMSNDQSIVIDRSSGMIFLQDFGNWRIDEYTPSGGFVLTIGQEVNKVADELGGSEAEKNLCRAGEECQAGTRASSTSGRGAFKFVGGGNDLAIGGSEGLLYVGDEDRVQEFDPASGQWLGELPLPQPSPDQHAAVGAMALDNSCSEHEPELNEFTVPTCAEFDSDYGDLFIAYQVEGRATSIHKLKSDGTEIADGSFPLSLAPRDPHATLNVLALAVDGEGRLAVSGFESLLAGFAQFGYLYDGRTGHLVTQYETHSTIGGLAFDSQNDMYAASQTGQEVESYSPVSVAELLSTGATCGPDGEEATKVVIKCVLEGAVDPWGVPETEVWFLWGKKGELTEETPHQSIGNKGTEGEEESAVDVNASVAPLRPNAEYTFELEAYDRNVTVKETPLTSSPMDFATPLVEPKIVGSPHATFVKTTSAILNGEIDPENARTEYFFEVAPQPLASVCPTGIRNKTCVGVITTPVASSATYGELGVSLQASSLRPGQLYYYRLFAESESRDGSERLSSLGTGSQEGTFTTGLVPTVVATTEAPSGITATSAVIAGGVDADGQAATYAFEVGLADGDEPITYGVVATGAVEAGEAPSGRTLTLTGLQPSTTYVYRIRLRDAYGEAVGDGLMFTTAKVLEPGLPSVPEILPVPPVRFPPGTTNCKKGYIKGKNGKCVKKTKKTKKKTSKKARPVRKNEGREVRVSSGG